MPSALSSFLRDDHLGDEVDDGAGRLVGVDLGEEVADVVRGAALLTGHEAKQPARSTPERVLGTKMAVFQSTVESSSIGC